jgi:hypothetical protein
MYNLLKGKKRDHIWALDENSTVWKTAERTWRRWCFVLTNLPASISDGYNWWTWTKPVPKSFQMQTSVADLERLVDQAVEDSWGKIDFVLHLDRNVSECAKRGTTITTKIMICQRKVGMYLFLFTKWCRYCIKKCDEWVVVLLRYLIWQHNVFFSRL